MSYRSCSAGKTFLDETIKMQSDGYGKCGFTSVNTHDQLAKTLGPASQTPPPPPADTTAPTVAITTPSDGATLGRAQEQAVKVAATDDRGVTEVEVRLDGALVGKRATGPFDFSVNLTVGSHTVEAVARDAAANEGRATITLTVTQPSGPTSPGGTPGGGTGKVTGDSCSDHGECTGGVCAADADGARFCTELCDPALESACGDDHVCLGTNDDTKHVCARPPAVGPPTGATAPADTTQLQGGCSLTGGPSASTTTGLLLLFLGGVLALRRRSSRRERS